MVLRPHLSLTIRLALVGALALILAPLAKTALAAPNDLVISEIMYDFKGSDDKHEWVEVFNSGTSAVSIKTGTAGNDSWRFSDGPPPFHTFKLYPVNQSPVTIPAGSYAILADDPATFLADYPTFDGMIFKVSMSLNNTADTVKLSADKGATFFGAVSYQKSQGGAGNGKTLELDGGVFRESYVDGGTPGKANSAPPPTAAPSKPVYTSKVVVNEVYPNPNSDQQEFVELYNVGSREVDLSNWQIDDLKDGGSPPYVMPSGTVIAGGGYLVFYDKISLNNDGDWARLLAPDGGEQSVFHYDNSTKGRSWSRDLSGTFSLSRVVTAGRANEFSPVVRSRDIVINEIVPDPAGSSDDEMIELRNLSPAPVDITDWRLDDIADGGSKPYVFPDNTIVPAGGYWIIYNTTSGVGLNNDGDHARLIWEDGTTVSDIVYSKSQAGESYSRREDGIFEWTPFLTPGSPNQFSLPLVIEPVISPPETNPLPQSPILDNSQFSVPNFQTEQKTVVVSASNNSMIELAPPPPKIAGENVQFDLPAPQKEDTIVPQSTVFTSISIFFIGGLRQWYIRRGARGRPKKSPKKQRRA